jgi:hypothetical protein
MQPDDILHLFLCNCVSVSGFQVKRTKEEDNSKTLRLLKY